MEGRVWLRRVRIGFIMAMADASVILATFIWVLILSSMIVGGRLHYYTAVAASYSIIYMLTSTWISLLVSLLLLPIVIMLTWGMPRVGGGLGRASSYMITLSYVLWLVNSIYATYLQESSIILFPIPKVTLVKPPVVLSYVAIPLIVALAWITLIPGYIMLIILVARLMGHYRDSTVKAGGALSGLGIVAGPFAPLPALVLFIVGSALIAAALGEYLGSEAGNFNIA